MRAERTHRLRRRAVSHPVKRPPLILRPGRSRFLTGFVLLVHLLGACSLVLTALPLREKVGLSLALLISLGYTLGTHARRLAPWTIHGAHQNAAGDWTLRLVSGEEIRSAKLLRTGFIGQQFAVLNFRTRRLGYRTLVLVSDAIDAEGLRRLRTGEGFRQSESSHPSRNL